LELRIEEKAENSGVRRKRHRAESIGHRA